jgi:putative transposase
MNARFTQLAVHIVLVTKFRRNLIPQWFEARFWSRIWEIARALGIHVYAVGGIENHIHILYEQPTNMSLATVVKAFKGNVSRWVSQELKRDFEWQPGCGAFHVDRRGIPRVVRYIENQREHHRRPKVNRAFNELVKAMDEDLKTSGDLEPPMRHASEPQPARDPAGRGPDKSTPA